MHTLEDPNLCELKYFFSLNATRNSVVLQINKCIISSATILMNVVHGSLLSNPESKYLKWRATAWKYLKIQTFVHWHFFWTVPILFFFLIIYLQVTGTDRILQSVVVWSASDQGMDDGIMRLYVLHSITIYSLWQQFRTPKFLRC